MLDNNAADILIVEDNDSERESILKTLKTSLPDAQIVALSSGTEAMDYLLARNQWQSRAGEDPPKLILLDLELPGSNGFSVLGQIRSIEPKDALTITPVVVFTDSADKEDVGKSYHCGANSYVMKPVSFKDFEAIVNTIGQYWITHNKTQHA